MKLALFADDTIWYIENPNDSTRKNGKANKFGKAAGYKINKQKLVVFLHAGNEQKKINKTISFVIAPKKNKS